MSEVANLRRALDTINSAWTTADVAALRSLFHADMVIVGPGYQQFASGRDACIESYREFSTNAKVLAYEASEPMIQVWTDTAVCSYSWTMTWQRTGDPVSDVGTVRANLKVEPDGEAVFRMRDAKGTIRVKLGASEDGSGLLLLDDRTEPAMHLLAKRTGTTLTLAETGKEKRVIKP